MPLEVSAELDRHAAIYLAGETISIKITVTNVSPRRKTKEQLAWGSVQLTCERTMGAATQTREKPTFSMTKSASTVYSSIPTILFCDAYLASGETRSFQSKIILPKNIPSSFRGFYARYLNRIAVAVQHVKMPIKLVYLQVRILPSISLDRRISTYENPFALEAAEKPSVSEIATSLIDDATVPRKNFVVVLANSDSKVAILTMAKKTFRLGEDIFGYLNFSDSDIKCVQYAVYLETEEILIDTDNDEKKSKIQQISKSVATTIFNIDSSFRVTIPHSAFPSFETDKVQLKWRIRFLFVVSDFAYKIEEEEDESGTFSHAPDKVEVESFSWSTDVYVFSCSPQNAAVLDSSHPNAVSFVV